MISIAFCVHVGVVEQLLIKKNCKNLPHLSYSQKCAEINAPKGSRPIYLLFEINMSTIHSGLV